jgi:hypothetical protein
MKTNPKLACAIGAILSGVGGGMAGVAMADETDTTTDQIQESP